MRISGVSGSDIVSESAKSLVVVVISSLRLCCERMDDKCLFGIMNWRNSNAFVDDATFNLTWISIVILVFYSIEFVVMIKEAFLMTSNNENHQLLLFREQTAEWFHTSTRSGGWDDGMTSNVLLNTNPNVPSHSINPPAE